MKAQTEAEFVAERMKAHHEACAGLDEDPVFQLLRDGQQHVPPLPEKLRAMLFQPGVLSKRQAE